MARRLFVSAVHGRAQLWRDHALIRLWFRVPDQRFLSVAGMTDAGTRPEEASPWGVLGRALDPAEVSGGDMFLDLGCGSG